MAYGRRARMAGGGRFDLPCPRDGVRAASGALVLAARLRRTTAPRRRLPAEPLWEQEHQIPDLDDARLPQPA